MSRDYGKVSPQFWTGQTGKALRGHPEAQVVALYLMTCPSSTMIGVFSLPVLYIAHETGMGLEGASKGLARCIEVGFCTYDDETEIVFVHEMAAHQVGDVLLPKDLRRVGIAKQYGQMAEGRIKTGFHARYGIAYGLEKPAKKVKGLGRGLQAPTKPEAGTGAEAGKIKSKNKSKSARSSNGDVTLPEWLAALPEGEDVIRDEDPIFEWAESAGIPTDWLHIAWRVFKARYTDDPKSYTDWRAVFRRAVREDWLRAWRTTPQGLALTTTGEQWKTPA